MTCDHPPSQFNQHGHDAQRLQHSISVGIENMGKHLGVETFAGDATMGLAVEREHGCAIKRVLDAKSRKVVGWLYEFGTGDHGIMWKAERCKDVIYE